MGPENAIRQKWLTRPAVNRRTGQNSPLVASVKPKHKICATDLL
jgi:hypothetical protein